MFQRKKWLRNIVLFSVSALINFGCATGLKKVQSDVDSVTRNLSKIFTSPNSPWNDFNLLEHPILFISFKERWVELFHNNQRDSLDFATWENRIPPTQTPFDAIEWHQRKYLIIHLDNQSTGGAFELTALAVHEGFHTFEQARWSPQNREDGRGLIYPFQAIPRYYRWEMQKNLVAYLETKKTSHLNFFSYWFKKWKDNFGEEYNNYTDRIEGSAQYFSNVKMTQLRNWLENRNFSPFENLNANPKTNRQFSDVFSLSYESYVLGTLAGIVLSTQKVPKWRKQIEFGRSPLEILAEKYKPKRETFNPTAQREFMNASLREMEKVDAEGVLDTLISDLANTQIVHIAIANKNLQMSSFSTSGMYRSFFNFPGVKGVEFIKLSSPHTIQNENLKIPYKSNDYWVVARETPCGQDHSTLLLLKPEQVEMTGEQMQFKEFSDQKFAIKRQNIKGVPWICLIP